uniref:Uncharacterized protein n=1 Tax=Lepeophtheirus salmonis TaxID=72036 RepID=A0A0K2TW14_LEPSM
MSIFQEESIYSSPCLCLLLYSYRMRFDCYHHHLLFHMRTVKNLNPQSIPLQ